MTAITLDDLQNDVLYYLQLVEAGETLAIVQAGAPMAEIRPVTHDEEVPYRLRPAGLCAGEFIVPDNFDAPLPADVLDAFEGR
jgi:antitoxin (DNA-binding transcriptional repressor) of toxin-antitoxin stability system